MSLLTALSPSSILFNVFEALRLAGEASGIILCYSEDESGFYTLERVPYEEPVDEHTWEQMLSMGHIMSAEDWADLAEKQWIDRANLLLGLEWGDHEISGRGRDYIEVTTLDSNIVNKIYF